MRVPAPRRRNVRRCDRDLAEKAAADQWQLKVLLSASGQAKVHPAFAVRTFDIPGIDTCL
jgi:hypothetical protein